MGVPIEIDLQDGDGMIVSVAEADSDVWAGISAQAQQLVANKPGGFGLIVNDRVFNKPERTLDSVGAVQNWLASQSNVGGARRPVTGPSTTAQSAAPTPDAPVAEAPTGTPTMPVPLPLAGAVTGALLGVAVAGIVGAVVGGVAGWWAGRKIAASL